MVELRVNIGGQWYPVDLFGDEQISVTKQFTDLENLQSPASDFTRQFTIPVTNNNQVLFGQIWYSTEIPTFDPRKIVLARIDVAGLPLSAGSLQYRGSTVDPDRGVVLEWAYFAGGTTLAAIYGDKRLPEIDLSALTHTLTYPNIVASWSGALLSGAVRYGLIDKGQNWDTNQATIWSNNNPIRPSDFTPFVRLTEVVTAILALSSIDVDPDFLSDPAYADIYMPAFGGQPAPLQDAATAQSTFRAVQPTSVTVGAGSLNNADLFILGFNDGVLTGFDDGTNWTNALLPTPAFWNPPFSGTFQISISVTVRRLTTIFVFMQVQIRRLSDNALIGILGSGNLNNAGACNYTTFSNTTSVVVDGSQNYYFAIYVQTQATGNIFTLFQDGASLGAGCGTASNRVSVLQPLTLPQFGFDVDLAANLPNVPIIDLLRSLQVLENLVIVPDPLDTNRLTLQSWETYVGLGANKDWADKLDMSKPIQLRPTTDLQKNRYVWTYEEGDDFLNAFIQSSAARVYGRREVLGLDDSWSLGDLELSTPSLAPYVLSEVYTGTGVFIHKMVNDTGQILSDPTMRLAFWCGLKDAALPLKVLNDATGVVLELNQWPAFSHQDEIGSAALTDLNFAPDFSTYVGQIVAPENRWTKNWHRYYEELYGETARIMTAYLRLSPEDIATFSWNHRIWLNGDYWRPLKVYAYDPADMATTKMDLLKIVQAPPICQVTPIIVNLAGDVQFVDPSGSPAPATEACCVAFGYTWTGTACKAWNSPPTGPPIGPNNGGGGGGGQAPNNPPIGGGSAGGITAGIGGVVIGPEHVTEAVIRSIVVGENITIAGAGRNILSTGRNHSLLLDLGRDSMVVHGTNALGFAEGTHYGGGFWAATEGASPTNFGEAQSGASIWRYEGAFDFRQVVDLYIEGKILNFMTLPTNCILAATCHVVIMTSALGLPEDRAYAKYTNLVRSRGGILAITKVGSQLPETIMGTLGSPRMIWIATPAPAPFRLILRMEGGLANLRNTRIVCTMQYTLVNL